MRTWGGLLGVKDPGALVAKGEILGKEDWYGTKEEEKRRWEHTKEAVGVKS